MIISNVPTSPEEQMDTSLDVSLQVMIGGDNSLVEPLFRSMLRCAALDGIFIIATNKAEQIVGVSIWFGPGSILFGTLVGLPLLLCMLFIFIYQGGAT